jgi:hypothetical protein
MKPFLLNDEIVLKPDSPYEGCLFAQGPALRTSSMIEVAAAIIGLFSVSIFLAHAVEAYQGAAGHPRKQTGAL